MFFDWLLPPNYLGSPSVFDGQHTTKGHLPGASQTDIRKGMEKLLKCLHQQVLPFILRIEKGKVLKELPPKTMIDLTTKVGKLGLK